MKHNSMTVHHFVKCPIPLLFHHDKKNNACKLKLWKQATLHFIHVKLVESGSDNLDDPKTKLANGQALINFSYCVNSMGWHGSV